MEIERELIAERTIYAIDRDSKGFEIKLMIGKPYPSDLSHASGDWACPVAAMGWHGVFPDMHGVDSWQALMNARNLLHNLLSYFVADGGRLFLEENGEEISFDEVFGQEEEKPDPQYAVTCEEYQEQVDALAADDLKTMDDALMAGASIQFRKVARVIGIAMEATRQQLPHIPDSFYAIRVQKLVKDGRLVSQGNLEQMRFSDPIAGRIGLPEVVRRLPTRIF